MEIPMNQEMHVNYFRKSPVCYLRLPNAGWVVYCCGGSSETLKEMRGRRCTRIFLEIQNFKEGTGKLIKRNYIPVLLALAALGWLIARFPPFQITWMHFLPPGPEPVSTKLAFLFKVYGLPCLLSLAAVTLLQMQGKLGALGAQASTIFPVGLFASGCLMSAFRSMISGVGGVPGYALGMALGYTLMSRVHSLQPSGRILFGRPMMRIVWRGEIEAQRKAAMRLQARGDAGGSLQSNVCTNTSNSMPKSSLSLSRAEAGT